MFRVVQHEWEETGMHLRYLWAKHPAIAGGSVHRGSVSPRLRSRCLSTASLLHALLHTSRHQHQPAGRPLSAEFGRDTVPRWGASPEHQTVTAGDRSP